MSWVLIFLILLQIISATNIYFLNQYKYTKVIIFDILRRLKPNELFRPTFGWWRLGQTLQFYFT